MQMTLREIAEKLGLEFEGDGDLVITGVAGLKEAGKGDISFLSDHRYIEEMKATSADAVVMKPGPASPCRGTIRAENPYFAFSNIMWLFAPKPEIPPGVMDGAYVDGKADLADSVTVMAGAFIAPGASIGKNTLVYPGVYIGHGSSVGDDCVIYPNVTIREGVSIGNRVIMHPGCVIGADGYGYALKDGVHHKIPQIGGVLIEDDVEIGANSCIDRGAMDDTVIKRGTKIDNLVQVAHNVKVGEHCLLIAQVGISGSTELGHHVVLAGQVGIVGHLKIGDGVMVGAKSGVSRNLKAGGKYSGIMAVNHSDWLKSQAVYNNLYDLKKDFIELKKKVAMLEGEE